MAAGRYLCLLAIEFGLAASNLQANHLDYFEFIQVTAEMSNNVTAIEHVAAAAPVVELCKQEADVCERKSPHVEPDSTTNEFDTSKETDAQEGDNKKPLASTTLFAFATSVVGLAAAQAQPGLAALAFMQVDAHVGESALALIQLPTNLAWNYLRNGTTATAKGSGYNAVAWLSDEETTKYIMQVLEDANFTKVNAHVDESTLALLTNVSVHNLQKGNAAPNKEPECNAVAWFHSDDQKTKYIMRVLEEADVQKVAAQELPSQALRDKRG